MKKASLTVLVSLSMLAGAAYAQEANQVYESTDPGKISDIEQRAQALQTQQEMQPQSPAPKMHHKPMHHHKKEMKQE